MKLDDLRNRLIEIYNREGPPQSVDFLKIVESVNSVLESEDNSIRPHNASGLPGGIVLLNKTIPTIIVPDIHARMDFFLNIMLYEDEGVSNLEKLELDMLQILCVGDGVHAERRAAQRWADAFNEYKGEYSEHENMDEEMRKSFGVMEMIMEVKTAFPKNFHFLKGNHENISNEEGNGNYPFRKFSYEEVMVAYYVEKFYDEDFLKQYYLFEKNIPLFAIGKNFLVSHAEPLTFFARESIIEYRDHPDVTEGLTWTANDAAEDGSVAKMIDYYINNNPEIDDDHESDNDVEVDIDIDVDFDFDVDVDSDNSNDNEGIENIFYFAGHRPVSNLYETRANGKFIQFHNPERFIIAVIKNDKEINIDEDIIEIENRIDDIIS